MTKLKRRPLIWIAFTICMISLAGLAIGLRPVNAAGPVLELDPSPLHLVPGVSTDVDVWVRGLDGTTGLESYDITLEFSPEVLTIDGVEGGDSPFDETPEFNIDNPAGTVSITATIPEGVDLGDRGSPG